MFPTSTNTEVYAPFLDNATADDLSRDDQYVILELSNKELKLIGHILHVYLAGNPDSPMGNKLLKSLTNQTDSVRTEPNLHKVYRDQIPFNAVKSESVWIQPFEKK